MASSTQTSNPTKTSSNSVLFFNFLCLSVLCIFGFLVNSINSQGAMIEPQQRSRFWRKGSKDITNLRSHQLDCGGRHSLILDKRKCGTCSVQYERESYQRKHHNSSGKVRRYPPNTSWIPVSVHLKLFQHGYFEFRICSVSNISTVVGADCLKTDKLKIKETGSTLYYPKSKGWHHINLVLSRDIKCDQCVLQWKYKTSRCKNGSEGRACGHQIEFYNCADIAFNKLISNNDAQEERKLQNMKKNERRKKRNALRFSSKMCKPNEECRQQSVFQSLFGKIFHTHNDSGSNMAERIPETLLTSENLLPSDDNLRENELDNFELGSTSGHYFSAMEPRDFSDYGSGGLVSGEQRSNAFSVEQSLTVTELKSQNLNTTKQFRKIETNENKETFLNMNMSSIDKDQLKESTARRLNSSNSFNVSERQRTIEEIQSQLISGLSTTERTGSFSGFLVEEELIPITTQTPKTNNSTVNLNEKTKINVSSKTDETNKQLTATVNNDLTIFPTNSKRKTESDANNSIPKLSDHDKTKIKENKNCTNGNNCPFKKTECVKKIECSNTRNGTIQCVTVESCSLITDIFQGLLNCSGHRKTIRCRGRGIYRYMKGISSWCENMCKNQGCQLSVCNCDCRRIVSCGAVGIFRIVPGSKIWCQTNCAHNYCPSTHCGCQ